MRKNVLLGFSGGIDSTAAARYLAEQGHAVTLLTLDTVGEEGLETRIRQAAGRLNHRLGGGLAVRLRIGRGLAR